MQNFSLIRKNRKRGCALTPTNKPRISMGGPDTVAELVAHYRLKELVGENQGRKSLSTRAGYESYLNGWILPRWGDHRLDHVKSVAVEGWLDSIKRAKGNESEDSEYYERDLSSRYAVRVG